MAVYLPLMHAVRFSDEYELVAPLYGVEPEELRQRDLAKEQAVERWVATGNGVAVGAVDAWLRPDDRLFLTFRGDRIEALAPLVAAVDHAVHRSLFTTVDLEDGDRVYELHDCGFTMETVGERFTVRFSDALALVDRAWVPTGYRIASVADVDEHDAFELDNAIRNLVPGTDGWTGKRDWFHDELNSAEFDRDAYLVAVERATDRCVGLLRIWRNQDGPRLGLLGVLPDHRRGPLAAALLKQGLDAASGWGYDSFVTETSPSNDHTYPRLSRIASDRLGSFGQLVRCHEP
ncbi:MAG: GNAT family N-acetyltransferase [Acidimicrobiia bacterium]